MRKLNCQERWLFKAIFVVSSYCLKFHKRTMNWFCEDQNREEFRNGEVPPDNEEEVKYKQRSETKVLEQTDLKVAFRENTTLYRIQASEKRHFLPYLEYQSSSQTEAFSSNNLYRVKFVAYFSCDIRCMCFLQQLFQSARLIYSQDIRVKNFRKSLNPA